MKPFVWTWKWVHSDNNISLEMIIGPILLGPQKFIKTKTSITKNAEHQMNGRSILVTQFMNAHVMTKFVIDVGVVRVDKHSAFGFINIWQRTHWNTVINSSRTKHNYYISFVNVEWVEIRKCEKHETATPTSTSMTSLVKWMWTLAFGWRHGNNIKASSYPFPFYKETIWFLFYSIN